MVTKKRLVGPVSASPVTTPRVSPAFARCKIVGVMRPRVPVARVLAKASRSRGAISVLNGCPTT